MGWYDDINRAVRQLKEIIDIPDDKIKDVQRVLEQVWGDARNYDVRWDGD